MFTPRLARLARACLAIEASPRSIRHERRTMPRMVIASRGYATPPPQDRVNDSITIQQYHQLSDETMDLLVDQLESLLDESGNREYEIDYASGVMTLRLGEHGTYVVNKQPPNKQIWLSSPRSGPKRYDYVPADGSWRYSRDNHSMLDLLNEELPKAFGKDVHLSLERV